MGTKITESVSPFQKTLDKEMSAKKSMLSILIDHLQMDNKMTHS